MKTAKKHGFKNKIKADFEKATKEERKNTFLRIAKSMDLNLPELQKNNSSCTLMYQSFINGDFDMLYTFFTDPFSCLKHIDEDLFYNVHFTNPFNGEYVGF